MQLTRNFSAEQFSAGLESWQWLDIAGKQPWFTSQFGDVFFKADDGIWYLETLDGKLTRPWHTAGEMTAELETPDGRDRYLLAGLVYELERRGLVPGESEVYDFAQAPVLGGAVDLDNIWVADFVLVLNVGGQIHEQIRDLPPGATVNEITVDET